MLLCIISIPLINDKFSIHGLQITHCLRHTQNGTIIGISKSFIIPFIIDYFENCVLKNFSRAPGSLVHPKKIQVDKNNNNINDIEFRKPKATRHLILIRHGQYEVKGATDEERILTKLGRTQAEYTGVRLRELGLPYTTMVKSTMARAQETANIIAKELPEVG